MARFFINRPIVAMVIALLMVIAGAVAILALPVAQYPEIVPPQVVVQTTFTGADAVTVEQSVATPIEQQMTGVENMNYMYSINANNGVMQLTVNFEVGSDPDTDQILAQMRLAQAESALPIEVTRFGLTVQKSAESPLLLIALYSPRETYDRIFLTNYAFINLNDPLTRVPGVGRVQVFGAQYAMRIWVRPDRLARLGVTVPEIVAALQAQNTVNPSGQIGSEPVPPGQEYTYSVRARGRLETPEEFGQIVLRAEPDGSVLRLQDVARIELGAQTYNVQARFNGQPAAVMAVYQSPGSNSLDAVDGVRALMDELSQRFPSDVAYQVSLDTTLAVREGIREILRTLVEAIALVALVVFVFLQSWRAALIPMLAVPVSLVGTFAVFPLLGFSINTLSLFGLVLAIGLVVDDAIIVVEAVEHHIEQGLSPRDAAFRAMAEVSAPVVAIALILVAVFVPTAFIPGITGRLYQQFAVTIAVSIVLSAINALSLSPALAALLLRPRRRSRGLLARFFDRFNRVFGAATDGYIRVSALLIRRWAFSLLVLGVVGVGVVLLGRALPSAFLPQEDQGFALVSLQLPDAASLERTDAAARKIEAILADTPGVQHYTSVMGFNLLNQVQATYSGFFFVTLRPWSEREDPAEQLGAIQARVNGALAGLAEGVAFSFPPPVIPGIGTTGGVTFVLQDRTGRDVAFLAENTRRFLEAARRRPELASLSTTLLAGVPQVFVDVDRARVIAQGVRLADVYQTMQAFMGGAFVNYFNRFGRQWQVYVQAEGEFRTRAENIGQFFVTNAAGTPVPLSAVTRIERTAGPEFTMRYNGYRAAQIIGAAAPGYSTGQAMAALEAAFAESMPPEMGFGYLGMSFQEQVAAEGVPAVAIFGLSLLVVFLILAAQYESWSLPLSVLLTVPVAVLGAFLAMWLRGFESNVYAQIGLVMLIGLSAKNAILIVEFARNDYERGRPLAEAALGAARLRFRPILMTSFAFVMGVVPLAVASGAGSAARRVLGTAVIGGMLAATLVAVFLVPATFYVVERFIARGRPEPGRREPPPAPEHA